MAGLLDWITGAVKQQYAKGAPYREAIGGLLQGDPTKFGLLAQEFNRKAQTPEGALDVALNFAPLGITAWHGSPYQFTKFDPAKIGTGEGAQAYGHGLYFAENPNVAKQYQKALSKDIYGELIDKSGKTFNALDLPSNTPQKTAATIWYENPSLNQAKKRLEEISPEYLGGTKDDVYKEILNLSKSKVSPNKESSLYKVDIADETLPRMLDWDKPISEQSKEVQKAISPILKTYGLPSSEKGSSVYQATKEIFGQEKKLLKQRDALFNKYQKEGMSMSDAVRAMTPEDRASFSSIAEKIGNINKAQEMASNYLQKRGISGIKYLDEGSRISYKAQTTYKGNPYGDVVSFPTKKQLDDYIAEKSQEGFGVNTLPQTSNYVVFDPNTIKILERNGLLVP